ncbi:MAG: gliding motility-associated C-terminal domain-containing protein [Bacteroidota bacterium]
MKQFYFFLFIFLSISVFAQVPANDICANAQAIALPQSGYACINSSNINATSDNSTNTCDVGTAGNEVWFTYVATGANNVITVTPNGATPASGMVVTLITSGCTSGVYDICNSATGTASVASTLGLAPGTVVLISVETNGADGTFEVCISSTPPSSSPGDGCAQSSLVCNKSSIDFPDLTGFTASGTSPSCFSGMFGSIPVRKDVWVKFTVGTTGTLQFTGTVLGTAEYDWALYNITSGCLGTEVSCDYDFSGSTTTFGMSSTTPTGTNFNAPITVTAGQTYALLIDNYSQNNVGFTLDWGGTFQMGTTAIFTVNPQSSCSVPVTVNITNGSVGATTYTWNYGDGSTSTTNNATHTYTATGDYLISLIANGNGCTSVYSQRVNLNSGPVISITPLTSTICPPSSANLNAIISLGTPYNDYNFTNNPNVAIPSATPTGVTNTITSTGIITNPLTTGMVQSICFTINHTKHADIGNDALGNNVTITVNGNTYNFTPLPLPNVSGTATYCFPQSVLNAIMAAGGNANTPWVLKVADTRGGGGGTGSLVSWTVGLRDPNGITGYTWSPTSTMTNSNTLSPTVSPTTTTVYSLTATDKFGCTSTKTATVMISCLCPTLTSVNYGATVCKNTTTQMTPTVTGSGAISSGSYSSTPAGLSMSATTGIITPSLSTANTYTVTYLIAASGGCTAVSVNTVVTIKPTPTIAVTNTSVCDGSAVTLIASGASSYTWNTGATTASISVTPTVATIYTVTGTSSISCTNSNTVSVSINPIPTTTASTTGTLTCSTTTVALNSNTAGMSYTWAAPPGGTVGSANTQSTTASGAIGNYTLTIRSAAGCTFTTTTPVTQNTTVPTTTATTTGTLTCSTTTVALNSTLAGMNYTWTAPAGGSLGSVNSQSTIASGSAGTYTVKIMNPTNGCTYSTTTIVPQNTIAPTGVNAGASQSLTCASPSVTLNGSVASPTNAIANWTGPNVCGTASSFTSSACGAGVYTLTATNPLNGCIATSTVQIFPSTGAPSVTLNPVTTSITCTNTLVTVSISSTVSPATYSWSGNGIVSGNGTPTITVNQGGIFNFTLTNTTNSCTTSNNQTVVQNTTVPTTTASTTGTLTCSTTTVALNSTLAGMNYTWTAPTGGSVSSANTQSASASGAAGTYTIKVINPTNGCSFSTTTSVTQNTTVPTTTATTTGTLTCSTTTVALNSTLAGMNYTWTAPPGGTLGSANTQSTTASGAAGTYTVKVVNPSNGCIYTTTTAVTQNTVVPITTASTTGTLTCSTTTVTLNSSLSGMNYTWTSPAGGSLGSANTQSAIASGAAGIYSLSVINASNGCTYSTTTSVIQNTTVPTTTASTTGTINCSTSTVTLNSTLAGMNYTWTSPTGGALGSANSQSTTAGAVSGTYSLLVVNPITGCSFTTSTSVTQNSVVPTSTASTTGTLTCSTTAVALNSTLAGMNYTWSAPAGGSVASATTQSTTASGIAGTYSLTVLNPTNGCTFSTTTSVSQNTIIPTTTASTTGTLTCSTTTVALNSTLAGMNYTWTTPAGGSVGAPNAQSTTAAGAAGTYTIKVVNPLNGCTYTTTTTVTQNTIVPTTTASTSGTLTCSTTTVTLNSNSAGMNYTWTAPSGGSIANANAQSTQASGSPGTYSITVLNPSNGCLFTATTSVTQNTISPTGVNAGSNQTLTCSTPSVSLNGSVLTPSNASVNWTGPNVCGAAASLTTSACGAGQYTLTATNPVNGCVTTATVMVSPSAGAPSVTINPVTNTITCTNTLVTVSISSTVTAATYTWSGIGIVTGNGTQTITVNQGGTFNFTLTNTTNSCTTSNNQIVIQNTAIPTTSITTTGSLTCLTTSMVTLNASTSGMNYTWTAPSGGSVSNANSQSTSASGSIGIYSLTIQNPTNGCVYTTTTSVNQNTTTPTGVNAGSNQTLTCTSPSVSLNGSISTPTNATASWSGAAVCGTSTSYTTTACAAGIYTLTATNPSNGCVSTSTMQVFPVSGAPTVSVNPITNSITCTNTQVMVSLSSTVTPLTYTWSGTGISGSTITSSISVTQGGSFSYTVTNSGGCSTVGTATVSQNTSAPVTTANTTGTLTCASTSVILNSTLAGMNYTWTAPTAGTLGSTNTQSTTASGAAGTYTIKVVNPSNGCIYTTTTAVTQNTVVPITTASTTGTLTCSTTTVTLNSSLSGMNYTWTSPAGGSLGSANTQSAIASGAAGIYSLSVINASNGCTYSTTTSVTQNTTVPTTTATTSGTLTCATTSVALNSTLGGMNYIWTAPAGGSVSSANTQSTSASGTGGTYSLAIINSLNGCAFTTTTSVTQNTLAPTVSVSNTQTITCLSPSATLTATGGGNYSWSGPGITSGSNSSTANVNMPGVYSVSVAAANGCITTKTISVIKNTPTPTITISNTPTLTCLVTSVTINASGGGTYQWTGPGIVNGASTASPTVNLPGNYNVTVTAANGCTATSSGAVSQNTTMPVLTISSNTVINPGQETPLTISGSNTSYVWSPTDALSCTTCSNPIASPTITTEYCATTVEGICTSVACVIVAVELDCETNKAYDTPNAFSPNGDGNNDQFCLQGWKGCLSSFYVAVFNRWGNRVFESTEADFCWDGTYLGKLLDPAVFVYYIKAETINGDVLDKKGNITLIK